MKRGRCRCRCRLTARRPRAQGRRGRGVLRQPAARQRTHPPAPAGSLPCRLARRLRPARRHRPRLRRRRPTTAARRTTGRHPQDRRACADAGGHRRRTGRRHLARRPAGEIEDFRISIAGAQEKTAFLKHQGKWCRPIGSTPTTHIFKLPLGLVGNRQADMRTSVENEWLCARIVAAFGIPVANCEIGEFGAQQSADRRALRSRAAFERQVLAAAHAGRLRAGHRHALASQIPGGRRPGARRDRAHPARLAGIAARPHHRCSARSSCSGCWPRPTATPRTSASASSPAGDFQLTPLYDVLSAWPIIGKKANEIPLEKVKLAMALPGERPRYHLQEHPAPALRGAREKARPRRRGRTRSSTR